jgi:hypothetical protein
MAAREDPTNNKEVCTDLKPTMTLSDKMTPKEQNNWFKAFESYYSWNERILKTKPYETRIQFLHGCISPSLATLLLTDPTMYTDNGTPKGVPIMGETPQGDCLTKLREYLLANRPVSPRRPTPQKNEGSGCNIMKVTAVPMGEQ